MDDDADTDTGDDNGSSRSLQYRRKCTEGLSAGLFIFAIIGNATYGAQILLVSVERNYMLKHLPWILGSWGVMMLDCIVILFDGVCVCALDLVADIAPILHLPAQ